MSEHHHASHEHGRGHAGHHHGGAGHSHAPSSFGAAFAGAVALNALIVVAEVVAGLAGGSVALLSDAAHNASDVLGLAAAFAAHRLGKRPPSARFTYGLGATSILAALGNAMALLVVSGALALEAVQRFLHPEPVAAGPVMAVAAGAILVNGVSAWLLAPGQGGDLNLRAAVAHLMADAAVAAGVVVAAGLIALTGWRWVDPALSLAINVLIVVGTWRLLREGGGDVARRRGRTGVRADAGARLPRRACPGVGGLHDLHIWPMSTSETALTVHLVMPAGHPGDAFLMACCHTLRIEHGVGHATLQVETSAVACALAPEEVGVADLVIPDGAKRRSGTHCAYRHTLNGKRNGSRVRLRRPGMTRIEALARPALSCGSASSPASEGPKPPTSTEASIHVIPDGAKRRSGTHCAYPQALNGERNGFRVRLRRPGMTRIEALARSALSCGSASSLPAKGQSHRPQPKLQSMSFRTERSGDPEPIVLAGTRSTESAMGSGFGCAAPE